MFHNEIAVSHTFIMEHYANTMCHCHVSSTTMPPDCIINSEYECQDYAFAREPLLAWLEPQGHMPTCHILC